MTESRNYSAITSEAAFDALLARSKNDKSLLLVLFYASWHEPSKDLVPVLASIAQVNAAAGLQCASIDAEQVEAVSQRYSAYLDSVPSCLFIRSGQVVEHLEGADAPTLARRATQQLEKSLDARRAVASRETAESASAVPGPSASAAAGSPADALKSRLQRLVNAHPVMLFIKGTPAAPRCGFTRKLLQLMSDLKVTFGSFDILSDDSVRSGLKEYSDWLTYPQVYISGEFVGGLDVVTELAASGELIKLIPAHCIEGGKPHNDGPESAPVESVDARCDALLASHRVMLFMKGDRDAPQCGFSAKVVALLGEVAPQLDYGTFDILTDQAVREHLKQKSNWPTYPQVYIDKELIGGLDVLNDMNAQGELQPALLLQQP